MVAGRPARPGFFGLLAAISRIIHRPVFVFQAGAAVEVRIVFAGRDLRQRFCPCSAAIGFIFGRTSRALPPRQMPAPMA
jgi:hypothetical protein